MKNRRSPYRGPTRKEYERALRHEMLRSVRARRRQMELVVVERAVRVLLTPALAIATLASAAAGMHGHAGVLGALGVVTGVGAWRRRGARRGRGAR